MEVLIQSGLLIIGFVLLIKGADWFVDGAVGIATKFGIPQLVIGLTIVAMGTSAPEAAVSISAAMKGTADITIGNVVGSNILNILIILGVSSIITSLAVAKSTIKIETPFVIFVSLVLLAQGLDGVISFMDGIILWILFLIYLGYLFVLAKKEQNLDDSEEKEDARPVPISKALIFVLIGLGLIILGSNLAVDGATGLARFFGLSERFIGLTIVALGTSLPELFTSVAAARKKNADIAIGNIVGSNIFNILFVVGTSALIIPIEFAKPFILDTFIAAAVAALLLVCCLPKKKLTRGAGILMLICYVLYFVFVCL